MKLDPQDLLNFKEKFSIEIQKKYSNLQLDCPLNNDIWAYSLIGSNGFFIEIGAGRSGNSTFILEKFFNWSGILVEPVPLFLEFLKRIRTKSKIINKIVLDKHNQNLDFFEFTYDPHYSSVNLEKIINTIENNKLKKINNKDFINQYKVSSISLDALLKEENIREIDYLALDAEGSEIKILQGINFQKIRPKLISSESYKVIDLLLNNNYKQVINPYKDKAIEYEYYFIDKLYFKNLM